MVYVLDMLPIVSDEQGKVCFKVMMSWAAAVDGGVLVSLGLRGLSTDLGSVEGVLGLLGLRADTGCLLLEWEGFLALHC